MWHKRKNSVGQTLFLFGSISCTIVVMAKKRARIKGRWFGRKSLVIPLIVAVGVAVAGGYYLTHSFADVLPDKIVYYDSVDGDRSRSAGQTFNLPLYSNVPPSRTGGSPLEAMSYELSLDVSDNMRINKYSCGDAGPCIFGGVPVSQIGRSVRACIDIRQQNYGRNHIKLLTLNMTSLKGSKFTLEWFIYQNSISCDRQHGTPYGGRQYGGGTFDMGQGLKGEGSGPEGQSQGTRKGPSGGGSSGSQSNKTSQVPNPAPSSTKQGDKTKQPTIEPSPFYDGKQYAPGSDPVDQIGVISIAGHKINRSWPYWLGGIALLAIVGFGWWRYSARHTRKDR